VSGPRTPWREARFCVVDLETTGLDPGRDEIISYAAIPVEEGRVRPAGLVAGIARPTRMPPPETIRIHGLRPADLEDAPPLEAVLDELLEAMADRVLVAHVAAVETAFLGRALRNRGEELRGPVVDTARMAHAVLGGGDHAPALDDLASHLGLPVHRRHHAEGDALTTAQVFLALATRLDRRRPQTVRSLSRAGRRGPFARWRK
jgi:DNA polymerase-3 subunit epsilon